jgi:uncharacterized NAD(P)/FAD-binding protein YdhS
LAATQTIAIVGAGYSGALLAVHLSRRPGVKVTLIERSPVFGLGLAYGTTCPMHLLNVRSGRMSAFPDDPGHFVRWLAEHEPQLADPEGFAPRMVFGRYVRALLQEAVDAAEGRLELMAGEAVAVDAGPDQARITLADGRKVSADRAVLALGNRPPGEPDPEFAKVPVDRFLNDPWAPGALDKVKPADEVLLVGSGLTMIDVVLALEAQGWMGRALALSRRGLLPRAHDPVQAHAGPNPPPDETLSQRLKAFRRRIGERGWGAAMDEIRPFNQAVWRALDTQERRRFLRHLRPWWDVHRHRVAVGVAEGLRGLFESGRLSVAGGKIVRVEPGSAGVLVDWRPRGSREAVRAHFERVINCTGPLADLSKSPEALPRQLFESGVVRADPLRLGLDVDAGGRVIGRDGRVNPRLYAIGPLTKAESWEMVAVPEIRSQAAELAERLTA